MGCRVEHVSGEELAEVPGSSGGGAGEERDTGGKEEEEDEEASRVCLLGARSARAPAAVRRGSFSGQVIEGGKGLP